MLAVAWSLARKQQADPFDMLDCLVSSYDPYSMARYSPYTALALEGLASGGRLRWLEVLQLLPGRTHTRVCVRACMRDTNSAHEWGSVHACIAGCFCVSCSPCAAALGTVGWS